MKPTPSLTTATLITSAILLSVPTTGRSQQYSQGYYPQQQESGLKRVGRSVGNFFRRSFYGEAPTYTPPPAGYAPRSYSLDGPPVGGSTYANVNSYSVAREAPAYKKPPTTATKTAATRKTSTATSTKSKTKTPTVRSTTSSKRYTPPSKPSSFKKAPSHPVDDTPARSTDETVRAPEENPLPLPNSTPNLEADTPPSPPKTEAKLNQTAMNNTFPLPGATPSTHSISPTISDEPIHLGPTSTIKDEPPVKTTTTSSTGKAKSGSFLIGQKTNKPGRVVSPYAPYNELDITGLPAGSLALDPTTQKVFQVP
jgi:hypothetical protein